MKNAFIYALLYFTLAGFAPSQTIQKVNLGFGNGHLVKFSPNSNLIAIAVGHKVKLYRSEIQVASLSAHKSRITGLRFDEKGEFIMAGYSNGYIVLWDATTREIILDFKASKHAVVDCQFLKSPQRIALITRDKLSIWSMEGKSLMEITNPQTGKITSFAVNGNNRLIATGGNGHIINIYDDQGNFLREMASEQKWILSMAFSLDGKKLASGGSNGAINIWDVDTWTPTPILKSTGRINSLEFSNDGQYLAVGSGYFYLISITGEHHNVIYKKLSGAVLSSSFSPDGKEVCILEDLTQEAKIYDISDLNIPSIFLFRDEGDVIAPQIYVSNPPKLVNDGINYSKDIIDIQGSIFDDYGVRTLRINGIETPIRENGKFVIHLPLSLGKNYITLEATDINGNTSLKKFFINRKGETEEYDPAEARNFLFIVGINNYQYWPGLNNAVKDGNDLASVLMKDYDFKFSNITIIKDEQATQDNIYKGMRSLIEKVTSKDNLIVYFSGHGHFDELLNEGYWIPVNAKLDAPGQYLPNSSILKIIENINSQHTFLIADACFAGSLFSESPRGGYIEKVEKFKSRWGLASGRLEVVSDGEIGSNSPFAGILLNYLRENPENEFPVSQLIQDVKIQVSEVSEQTPIGNPLRLSGDEGGEFIFRRAKD